MKALACLLTAMSVGVCAAAAENPHKSKPLDRELAASRSTLPPSPYYFDPAERDAKDTTCYTIRAYLFSRSKDGAPRPVGTTTCVRSTQRDLRKIERMIRPAVRLVR
jgi:hypothetical protein